LRRTGVQDGGSIFRQNAGLSLVISAGRYVIRRLVPAARVMTFAVPGAQPAANAGGADIHVFEPRVESG
jgi:hypothetical protein